MTRRQKDILGILLGSALIPVLTNVATGILPEWIQPYLGYSWLLLLVGVVAAIGLQLWPEKSSPETTSGATTTYNTNTGGGDYAEGNIDKRTGAFIDGGTVVRDVIGQQTNIYNYHPAPTTSSGMVSLQRERRLLLSKVQSKVEDYLKQFLGGHPYIHLQIEPYNPTTRSQELHRASQPQRWSSQIGELFDESGESILILAPPGGGKTVLLFELARTLLQRVEDNPALAIPVVLDLSTWIRGRKPLRDWIVDELVREYHLPTSLATRWDEENTIALLLDGLDEVEPSDREACVSAINTYLVGSSSQTPIAVTSRSLDETQFPIKLHLHRTLVVQTLDREQIKSFFLTAESQLGGLGDYLDANSSLWDFNTPFMLNIALLTFSGKSASEIHALALRDKLERPLLSLYIDMMFAAKKGQELYSRQQAENWLGWLSIRMMQYGEVVFRPQQLQPYWLHTTLRKPFERYVGRWPSVALATVEQLYSLPGMALFTTLYVGLPLTLFSGSHLGLTIGLLLGIAFGVIDGLLHLSNAVVSGAKLAGVPRITPISRIRWSWSNIRSGLPEHISLGARVSAVVGVVMGMAGRSLEIDNLLLRVIASGVVSAMLGACASIALFLFLLGLGDKYLLADKSPFGRSMFFHNDDSGGLPTYSFRASFFSALLGGVGSFLLTMILLGAYLKLLTVVGLGQDANELHNAMYSYLTSYSNSRVGAFQHFIGSIITNLSNELTLILVIALIGALFGALVCGGLAIIQHYTLRWMLYRSNKLPLRLVPFLDFCVERTFLRRVGGGYVFIHRILMEHIASLYHDPD